MKPGERLFDVVVDGIDDEGRGRAVVSKEDGAGWDLAVRGAFPGDVADVVVERAFAARGLVQVRAVDVDEGDLHAHRTCTHRAPCAGCPLEGVDEGFVLDLKRARVARALADAGLDAPVAPVEPSRGPRQKVKLTAAPAAPWGDPGRPVLGLYVPHSHVLEDATRCPHQHPAITAVLPRVQAALAGVDVRAVIARAFVEGTGVVIVTGAAVDDDAWSRLAGLVDDSLRSIAVRVDERGGNSLVGGDVARAAGPQALTPLEGGPPASVDAFCQPDPALARFMIERAAAFLVVDGAPGAYLDAYAGAGGFARGLLARGAGRVVAVERAAASAATLRALSVDAIESSVEDALPALAARGPFAGLVADPPKSGLRDAAPGLARLGARRAVLVACDPDAGARDAKVFVDAGYRLVAVEPLDLFPATPEVETLLFLERAEHP